MKKIISFILLLSLLLFSSCNSKNPNKMSASVRKLGMQAVKIIDKYESLELDPEDAANRLSSIADSLNEIHEKNDDSDSSHLSFLISAYAEGITNSKDTYRYGMDIKEQLGLVKSTIPGRVINSIEKELQNQFSDLCENDKETVKVSIITKWDDTAVASVSFFFNESTRDIFKYLARETYSLIVQKCKENNIVVTDYYLFLNSLNGEDGYFASTRDGVHYEGMYGDKKIDIIV